MGPGGFFEEHLGGQGRAAVGQGRGPKSAVLRSMLAAGEDNEEGRAASLAYSAPQSPPPPPQCCIHCLILAWSMKGTSGLKRLVLS